MAREVSERDYQRIGDVLLEDEEVLWAGRPSFWRYCGMCIVPVLFTGVFSVAICTGLLMVKFWLGAPEKVEKLSQGGAIAAWVIGILLALVFLLLFAIDFIRTMRHARKTVYVVTHQRVFSMRGRKIAEVYTEWRNPKGRMAMALPDVVDLGETFGVLKPEDEVVMHRLPLVYVAEKRGGLGHIVLSPKLRIGHGLFMPLMCMAGIENAQEVASLIREQHYAPKLTFQPPFYVRWLTWL